MSAQLADRLAVLRDEILDTAELGPGGRRGAELFDAVLRQLASSDETSPGLDLSLHEAFSRRLAWGEPEAALLAEIDAVCKRLVRAAGRALRDPHDEIDAVRAATDVASAAARLIARAAASRAGRERAAERREAAAEERLEDALARQAELIAELEAALADD